MMLIMMMMVRMIMIMYIMRMMRVRMLMTIRMMAMTPPSVFMLSVLVLGAYSGVSSHFDFT